MKILAMLVFSLSLLLGAVDINTAGKSELITLKGIGVKKANAILEYRKSNCFKDVHALVNIKGIGKKFIEKNRENLKATKCKK